MPTRSRGKFANKAYTFTIELSGSHKPPIKRTVDVPASYTFQELHFVIQYAFGWQQAHVHMFAFYRQKAKKNTHYYYRFDPRNEVLHVQAAGDNWDHFDFLPKDEKPKVIHEDKLKLHDIYDERGKYRHLVEMDDGLCPLLYTYDLGDCWEHLVTFKGEKELSLDQPIFTEVKGYPPAEDCGGIYGWDEIRDAFAAGKPTKGDLELRKWTIWRMGLEGKNDPIAVGNVPYSPFNKVDKNVMNDPERWKEAYERYKTTPIKAYTFTIELMTGFKPPIKRTVDVPASFTFRDLHCVVQYAFGWDSSHVHMFSFYNQKAKKRGGRYIFNDQNEVLHVKAARNGFKPMFGAVPEDCVVREDQVKLSDVFDDNGKFREVVDMEGKPACPIVYTYDLGENWEHLITYEGEKTMTEERPIFTLVQGTPPKEYADPDEDSDEDDEDDEPAPPPKKKTKREILAEFNDPEKWQEKHSAYCSQTCQKTVSSQHCIDPLQSRTNECIFSLAGLGMAQEVLRKLHFTLQYAFGPWQNCHLHQFSFYDVDRKDLKSGTFFIDPSKEWLRVLAEGEELDEWPDMPGMPKRQGPRGTMQEKDMKLSDVFDEAGSYRSLVEKDGEVIPLIYLYDFGDNWEHLVTFKGEKMASADRPLFSKAVGYPPAEDAGGVTGWEEVKEAFAAERPTRAQRERRQWAIERMGYEDRNDPLAVGDSVPYSPFNEVNVEVMNYEGRWENHYRGYSGKEYYEYTFGDDLGPSDSDTDLSDVD
ncbi:MM3350-like domain-containing protein [Schizophyllum commune]